MTNNERVAEKMLEVFQKIDAAKARLQLDGYQGAYNTYLDPVGVRGVITAIIRREIPGMDELDALRQRVAVLEQGIQAAMKQANHRWSEWGERAEGVADILEAALSASPPATPDDCCSVGGAVARVRQEEADANAEIVRRLVAMVQETEWVRWGDPECGAGGESCPTCGEEKTDGHREGCERAACIADAAALRAGGAQ